MHPDQPGLEKELAACHESRCEFDPRKCPPVNHCGIMVVLATYTCESTTPLLMVVKPRPSLAQIDFIQAISG